MHHGLRTWLHLLFKLFPVLLVLAQVAGYVLSRVDLAVAVFLLLVYIRSMMLPKHVSV